MESQHLDRSTVAEVDEAIAKVKTFYAEGEAHLKLARPYGAPGTRSEKETLAKAKAFANPITGYTRQELNQLLSACRRQHLVIANGRVSQSSRVRCMLYSMSGLG